MRLKTLSGKLRYKRCNKYRIDWDCEERSKPQYLVKKFFEPYWKNCVCYREFPVFGTLLKIDLYNASYKIAVEIDGTGVHNEFNKFFHKDRIGYFNSITRDFKKEQFCEINNITLIRIYDTEIEKLSVEFIKEKFGISII